MLDLFHKKFSAPLNFFEQKMHKWSKYTQIDLVDALREKLNRQYKKIKTKMKMKENKTTPQEPIINNINKGAMSMVSTS